MNQINSKRSILIPLTMCIVLGLSNQLCFGYLDLGTGSYIIQVLIASLLGVSLAFKNFWRHIFSPFSALFAKKRQNGDQSDHTK